MILIDFSFHAPADSRELIYFSSQIGAISVKYSRRTKAPLPQAGPTFAFLAVFSRCCDFSRLSLPPPPSQSLHNACICYNKSGTMAIDLLFSFYSFSVLVFFFIFFLLRWPKRIAGLKMCPLCKIARKMRYVYFFLAFVSVHKKETRNPYGGKTNNEKNELNEYEGI